MVSQGGNRGAEGHNFPQGLGLHFWSITATTGIKTDPINITDGELETALRGNAAVVGGVELHFVLAGGEIGQFITLNCSDVFVYQKGIAFIDMQQERTGVLRQIPRELGSVLLDIFSLVGS